MSAQHFADKEKSTFRVMALSNIKKIVKGHLAPGACDLNRAA